MASSDDFKALLKAGNITEALALALSEAVELKFTTWVPSEDDVEIAEAKPGHRLRTRVNTIEGKVEHEIGEEFIGTGRYRDLKQFHLDQVAEGSKLIQNNLKSLQKLVEVLVALRYPETQTPVIEPESPDTGTQLLPPVETSADAGLATEPLEVAVADSLVIPDIITQVDTPVAGLVVESQETTQTDSLIIPDITAEDDTDLEPPPSAEQPASFVTAPTEEELEEEDDDDWDDSVLDLLESLPVVPPPTSETAESDLRENLQWNDLVEEESTPESEPSDSPEAREWDNLEREDLEPPPAPELQSVLGETTHVDDDLRDLVEQESVFESAPSDVQPDWDLESPPFSEPQNLQDTTTSVDDDLRDLVEQESVFEGEPSDVQPDWDLESPPFSEPQNLQDTPAPVDEDWGDLVEDEPTPGVNKPIPNLDSLNLDEDEEWDDWVLDEPESVVEPPVVDMDSLDLGEDDDWGDLVDDSETLTASPSFDESASNLESDSDEDWDDFTSEELNPSPALFERDSRTVENFDLFETLDDLSPLESDPFADLGVVEKRPRVEDLAWSEEFEPGGSEEQSDTQAGSGEDVDDKTKSAGKKMPPPPPPNRFSNPE
jgi:hypothetical protein